MPDCRSILLAQLHNFQAAAAVEFHLLRWLENLQASTAHVSGLESKVEKSFAIGKHHWAR